MIILNITVNISHSVFESWENWVSGAYISPIMQTGCFEHYKMLRLLNERQDADGPTYALQFYASDLHKVNEYASRHDQKIQQTVFETYGEKVMCFQTLLEEV